MINHMKNVILVVCIFLISGLSQANNCRNQGDVECLQDSIDVYLGMTNLLQISPCGYDSVQVFFKGEPLHKGENGFEFRLLFEEQENVKLELIVVYYKKNRIEQRKKTHLRIKDWGRPIAILDMGFSNFDSIPINHFKAFSGLICSIYEPLNVWCTVRGYNYSVIRADSVIFRDSVSGSPLWSDAIKSFMGEIKVGDIVIIDSIKSDCGIPGKNMCSGIIHYIK